MSSSSNFAPAAAPFNEKLHLYHYNTNNNRNVLLKNIGALSGNDVIFSGGGGNNRNASDNHLNLDNVSKSRVPDILMINKYYGLIPQKFTINTRKPPPPSPSSAKGGGRSGRSTPNNSKRGAKPSSGSGSNKPRAKSCSSSQNSRDRKSGGHSRSDCDSPDELIKLRQLATGVGHGPRKQQSCPSSASTNEKSNFDKSSLDPFGLVTKKMSVEKYKKWRNGAEDHPRSLNLAKDLSIGQTLSLTATAEDNEFPSSNNMNSHAKSVAGSAHRRVIKIDLNTVSWDEENYQGIDSASARSEEDKIVGSAKNSRNAIIDDNDSGQKSVSTTKEDNDANENQPSASKGKINRGENTFSSNDFSSISTTSLSSPDNPLDSMNDSSNFIGKQPETMNETVNGKKKLLSCGKNKALSFEGDGSSESGAGLGVKNCIETGNKKESKRRPVTASVNRVGSSSSGGSTFSTPNSFNPPSKVIPWTQQKTAGGKPLTLAERRAKLQRAPSIHSSASSSVSMEYGTGGEDEDGQSQRSALEDVESVNFRPFNAHHQNQHLPSSALRDTRKPLYVMQPPEVPTMIGQINPNADEDIQIEIEKVAIMLKKMQNKHNFSLSLDSGIEAELMGKSQLQGPSSTSPSQQPLKSAQSTGSVFSKLENSEEEDKKNESPLLVKTTGSLSSASSTDSSSAEEDEDEVEHKKSSLLNPKAKTKLANTPGLSCSTSDKFPIASNKENANQLKSNGEKMNPSQSQIGAGTTSTLQRRPPLLKKAVSISCEHELSKTGGRGNQNEVNLKNVNNTNDNGKRPKTATTAGENQRSLLQQGAGTRSTRNYHHHQRPSLSSENHSSSVNLAGGASGNGSGASQGSRNRRILIKKALMEINQAGGNLRRKWSTLGRPRTAPTSDKNNAKGQGNVSQTQSHQRKPLKASPFPISGMVKGAPSLSGKSPSPGSGACQNTLNRANQSAEYSSVSEGVKCDKSDSTLIESSTKPPKQLATSSKRRSMFRQCFSLDETQLLGFSMRSVHEGRFPVFETSPENSTSGEGLSSSSSSLMLNDEISFLSSEKREQCLKVYEKMKQTGCTVKLETILRGMLTPSEYRAFMREAEKATQEESRATEKARRDEEEEEDEAAGNDTKKSVDTPTEGK